MWTPSTPWIANSTAPFADQNYQGGDRPDADWQLPAANAVASMSIPLSFVNTHADADCGIIAAHRNAYPGVEYDHVVGVHGGKAPYYFELLDAPAGMTIFSQLVLSAGELLGWADLGRMTWPTPIAGSYDVTVRVTDQLGAQAQRVFTLDVGTANWVVLDPEALVNGIGTLASPYNTLSSLESGHVDKLCLIRGGTVSLDLVNETNNNFAVQSGSVNGFIGYPGEDAEIEQISGWFSIVDGDDYIFKNLTINHSASIVAGSDRKCIVQLGGDRHQFVDLSGTNYVYGTSSGNNGAWLSSLGGTDADQFLHNLDISGPQGTAFQCFKWRNALISCVKGHDADFANTDSSSNGGVIKLKDGWSNLTIRACEIWDNNTFSGNQACFDYAGQDQSVLGIDGTDVCYNKFERPYDASIQKVPVRLFTHNGAPLSLNLHMYRNSIKAGVGAQSIWYNSGQVPTTTDTARIESNVFENCDLTTFTETCFDLISNSSGTDVYFDSSIDLLVDTYLGTRSAQVAA